jgi:hypothetical protein
MTYRSQLLAQFENSLRDPASTANVLTTRDPSKIRALALALALPEPATAADASAQIDALQTQGAGIIGYARQNRDWARPVLDALTAAWNRDYSGRPATITTDALRALIAS